MVSIGGNIAGEKYLHIMIFKCEADWAYGMDMKKAMSNQDDSSNKRNPKQAWKSDQILTKRASTRIETHAV